MCDCFFVPGKLLGQRWWLLVRIRDLIRDETCDKDPSKRTRKTTTRQETPWRTRKTTQGPDTTRTPRKNSTIPSLQHLMSAQCLSTS